MWKTTDRYVQQVRVRITSLIPREAVLFATETKQLLCSSLWGSAFLIGGFRNHMKHQIISCH